MGTAGDAAAACLRDHLSRLPLSTVLRALGPRKLVIIDGEGATVEDCMRDLQRSKLLAAPVVAGDSRGFKPGETRGHLWPQNKEVDSVKGFIGIGDILAAFTASLAPDDLAQGAMLSLMKSLEDKGKAFMAKPISELKAGSGTGTFEEGDGDFLLTTQLDMPVLDVIRRGFLHPGGAHPATDPAARALTSAAPRVHRLVIVDSAGTRGGTLDAVFSMTDVVRYIAGTDPSTAAHPPPAALAAALAAATVADLPGWSATGCSSPCECVPPETLAIRALDTMSRKGLSAVGVVDSSGALIGNFSISDFRGIGIDHFGALALPVAELIALEHGTEYAGFQSSPHPFKRRGRLGAEVGQALTTAKTSSSLLSLLNALAVNRLHRVWVLDGGNKPLGVVSASDIIAWVAGPEYATK